MSATTTPALVIDVFPAAPADLRRRLQDRGASGRLPGGLVMEESASGTVYHLEAEGGWAVTQIAGEWHFSHEEGHVVVLGDHGVTVRPAE